jgi:hypothetical protein
VAQRTLVDGRFALKAMRLLRSSEMKLVPIGDFAPMVSLD